MAGKPAKPETHATLLSLHDKLLDLASAVKNVSGSMRSVGTKRIPVMGWSERDAGIEAIEKWLANAIKKVAEAKSRKDEFGFGESDEGATGSNRKPKTTPAKAS